MKCNLRFQQVDYFIKSPESLMKYHHVLTVNISFTHKSHFFSKIKNYSEDNNHGNCPLFSHKYLKRNNRGMKIRNLSLFVPISPSAKQLITNAFCYLSIYGINVQFLMTRRNSEQTFWFQLFTFAINWQDSITFINFLQYSRSAAVFKSFLKCLPKKNSSITTEILQCPEGIMFHKSFMNAWKSFIKKLN